MTGKHGGRWLLLLTKALHFMVLLIAVLASLFVIAGCPLWWKGAPLPPAYVLARLAPDAGVLEPASSLSGVTAIELSSLQAEFALETTSRWTEWWFLVIALVFIWLVLWILTLQRDIVASVTAPPCARIRS